MRPSIERDITAEELAAEWRKIAGPVPGAVDLTFQSQAAGGGNAIDLEISGPSIEQLEQALATFEENSALDEPLTSYDLSAFILFFSPNLFATEVWGHFSQRKDPCGYVGKIVDGTVLLDAEHF